ncbi:PAS domain S-box protein [bacterium]|nr:PAS domain S-box protein [bacterium]
MIKNKHHLSKTDNSPNSGGELPSGKGQKTHAAKGHSGRQKPAPGETGVQAGGNERVPEAECLSIIQTIPDIVYRLDADGRFTFISRAVNRYGWNPQELLGHHFLELVHPEDRQKASHRLDERRTGERSTRAFEIRLLNRNASGGQPLPAFLLDAEGLYLNEIPAADAFIGSQGVVREIDVSRSGGPPSLRQRDYTFSLVRSSPALYVALDSQLRVLNMNPAMLAALGYTLEEVLEAYYPAMFVPPEERDMLIAALEKTVRNETGTCIRSTVLTREGRRRLVDWFGRTLFAEDGSLDYIFSFGIDVTELERAEALLKRRSEFESLVASIATGFINILPEKTDWEISRSLEKIGLLLDLDCCLLYRLNENNTGLDLTHSWHASQYCNQEKFPSHRNFPPSSWLLQQLEKFETIAALKLEELPAEAAGIKELLDAAGVRSAVIVPLLFAGRLTGLIGFFCTREITVMDKEDVALLETTSHIISNALQHMQEHHVMGEYRAAVESAEDMIAVVDENYTYRLANWSYLEFVGRGREQVVGRHMEEVLGKEMFRFEIKPLVDRALAGEGLGFESVRQHNSMGERILRVHYSPMEERDGTRALVAVMKDITIKKHALEALKRSESKYRHLVENVNDVFVAVDREGRFSYVSPTVKPLTGYSPDDMLGRKFMDFIYLEDRDIVQQHFQNVLTGKFDPFEYRLVTRDRGVRWVHSSSRQMIENGKPAGIQGVFSDVTERKLAEHLLRESEEKYRLLIENSGVVVALIDREGVFHLVNSTAKKYLGEESLAKDQKTMWDFFPEDVAAQRMKEVRGVIDSGKELSVEIEVPLKNGARRCFRANLQPCFIPMLDIPVVQLIAHDVTELKKLEQERIKAGKLESIGLLAGGIAHDFNNVLTTILGNITLARLSPDVGEELGRTLAAAEQASMRARDLTRQLLTFSRGGAPVRRLVNPAELLREAVATSLRGTPVKGSYDIAPDLLPASLDESQIRQVIANLAQNAVQAMSEGGTLTLSAANICLEKENECSLPWGTYLQITLRDTGEGIPPENMPKIFDPYFSTRPGGVGLGLATCYSIVKRHGGCLRVESEPGRGSSFHVILPAMAEPEPPAPRKAEPPVKDERWQPAARILLLDDEPQVRQVISAMLGRLGHKVTGTGDGKDTLREYERALREGRPYDLVIMDLTIPSGMGGKETIAELRKLDPKVKAVVASGYSQDPILSDHSSFGFCGVVNKPFRMDDLIRTIAQALRQPSD